MSLLSRVFQIASVYKPLVYTFAKSDLDSPNTMQNKDNLKGSADSLVRLRVRPGGCFPLG